jgi:hypothetical protein
MYIFTLAIRAKTKASEKIAVIHLGTALTISLP